MPMTVRQKSSPTTFLPQNQDDQFGHKECVMWPDYYVISSVSVVRPDMTFVVERALKKPMIYLSVSVVLVFT